MSSTQPHPSSTCTHPADEWCDGCFMGPWERYVLSLLDQEAIEDVDVTDWVYRKAEEEEPGMWSPPTPSEARQIAEAAAPLLEDPASARAYGERLARWALHQEYMAGVHGVCVNGQHNHGDVARKASCHRPLAAPPLMAAAAGAAAFGVALTAACAVVAGYAAVEWLRTDGRLYAHVARQRMQDARCRWLG